MVVSLPLLVLVPPAVLVARQWVELVVGVGAARTQLLLAHSPEMVDFLAKYPGCLEPLAARLNQKGLAELVWAVDYRSWVPSYQ